ncbi:hypothetical protein U3516DRAFT_769391 [Neocallimastix sp. 'constans']
MASILPLYLIMYPLPSHSTENIIDKVNTNDKTENIFDEFRDNINEFYYSIPNFEAHFVVIGITPFEIFFLKIIILLWYKF